MKPVYKKLILGVCTVGVTLTAIGFATYKIRVALGKGAGQREATKEDKDNLEIVFVKA